MLWILSKKEIWISPSVAGLRSDDEIKQQIIKDSIASYPGTCACPYNVDRAGHRCGRRSAYSRPGGYAPLCYPNDVTKEMVEDYRKRRKE